MSTFAELVNRTLIDPRPLTVEEFVEQCDIAPLYPHQMVLLKLVFLEEMEGWEEDILTDWINGGYANEVQISPKIRERRDVLRDLGYKHFREVCLAGGRRSGKGYMTAIATCKKLAEAHALGDPGAHYGIAKNKEIYFTCVAASLEQAQKFQFSDIRDVAGSCKLLAPFIPALNEESFSVSTSGDAARLRELTKAGIKVNANYASLRVKPLAAQAGTIRGSASLVLIFDEMAHMIGTEGKSSAEEVYKASTPATKQFGSDAIIFMNSSPWSMAGQFYESVQHSLALDDKGLPKYMTMMSIRFPSWEMYRNYDKDKRRRFHSKGAVIVSPDWPDELLLTKSDKAKQYEEKLDEMKDPDSYRVEARSQWAATVQAFLRPEFVERGFSQHYKEREIKTSHHGHYSHQYWMHCDPASTTDGFGMAMAHVEELPYSDEAIDMNPALEGQQCKHVVFDTIWRWEPKDFPNRTIDYERVQSDLMNLVKVFYPHSVTFDQFNGAALSQWLMREIRNAGQSTMVSMLHHTQQQNLQMWHNFRQALNLNLIHLPNDSPYSEWAALELKFLEEKENGRVDHQTTGPVRTNDVATAIAVVTDKLLGAYIQNWSRMQLGETRPSFGSMGGYGINQGQEGLSSRSVENLRSLYAKKYAGNNVARSMSRAQRNR